MLAELDELEAEAMEEEMGDMDIGPMANIPIAPVA